MKMRQLGAGGPLLTETGLGAWALGGPWEYGWGPQEDRQSIEAIHAAIESGVNWIDTAAVYGLGHSEEVVSRALEGCGPEVFVATKCGMVWDEAGHVRRSSHPESIRREVEASLRRLRRERIDLYQIHWPDPDVPLEESWGAMVRLKEEGLVRWIGVSNYDVVQLETIHRLHPVQSLQPPYSLLRREVESEILPWCADREVGVLTYSPMASGLLTGRFEMSRLAGDDWRRRAPHYQEPRISMALELVERMRPMAAAHGVEVGQLAVAWVLHRSEVTAAIVGARKPEQARALVSASRVKLDPDELAFLEASLGELGLGFPSRS